MASDLEEQKKVLLPILQVHCLLLPGWCPVATGTCIADCVSCPLAACAPWQQRATEIEAMEPRVAYYCRLYALKRVRVQPTGLCMQASRHVTSLCLGPCSSCSASLTARSALCLWCCAIPPGTRAAQPC